MKTTLFKDNIRSTWVIKNPLQFVLTNRNGLKLPSDNGQNVATIKTKRIRIKGTSNLDALKKISESQLELSCFC